MLFSEFTREINQRLSTGGTLRGIGGAAASVRVQIDGQLQSAAELTKAQQREDAARFLSGPVVAIFSSGPDEWRYRVHYALLTDMDPETPLFEANTSRGRALRKSQFYPDQYDATLRSGWHTLNVHLPNDQQLTATYIDNLPFALMINDQPTYGLQQLETLAKLRERPITIE